MSKNLRLCYRIDKSLGLAVDEDGNYGDAFVCVKAKNVKSILLIVKSIRIYKRYLE